MIIAFPHPPGDGGPGSFQSRFQSELLRRGWTLQYAGDGSPEVPDVVFVVGGTRKLPWLHEMRRKGIPIVYRLDGLLWLHRVPGANPGARKWLECEARNALARWIHGRLADVVVYQSEFVRDWWAQQGWRAPRRSCVIQNGVDLEEFHPDETERAAGRPPEVVCVEGHLDYSPYAIDVLNMMGAHLRAVGSSLIAYGGFADDSKRGLLGPQVDYRGMVDRAAVPGVFPGRVYLSLDVNPACPNAVAEAMACGSPVIGFDTGAVRELVGDGAGAIMPFGGNPWLGESPDIRQLRVAYDRIAVGFESYSRSARQRAIEHFGLGRMVDAYVQVIERALKR